MRRSSSLVPNSPAKSRVLFLNRSYWPDNEATGQLLTELCESLSSEFDVHVLVGQPNTVTSDEAWQNVECRNGVVIHRVRHLTLPKSNILLKAINFVSFAIAAWFKVVRVPRPDVVIFETDPFLLPFVAQRLQRRSAVPMIGYLQDIYPDIAIALGKTRDSWMIRVLRNRMFSVYRDCFRMVVLSTDMKQLLLDSGISEDQISIIPNWANTDEIKPLRRSENEFLRRENLTDRFLVMYSGNLGLTQRLEHFVNAAALIDDSEIEFVFIGRGATKPNLKQLAVQLQTSNVRFLDYQPRDELVHSLSAADLHIIVLADELTQCLMPSKLYGVLAAGRPYLTNARPGSHLHSITVEENVGFVVGQNSPEEIAHAIRDAKASPEKLEEMGNAGRRVAEEKFTFKASQDSFREILRSASEHPSSQGIA